MILPSIRNRTTSKQDVVNKLDTLDTSKSSKTVQKSDIRSGRAYYETWDRYALECEKEMAEEDLKSLSLVKEDSKHSDLQENDGCKERNPSSGLGNSEIEKEWLAQREREKGNDLFKAKEYVASIKAYTSAINMFPKYAPTYANRAAAYIKMNRWDDVHKDCSKALEIEPRYVKALMRRGLASLESGNPEEAMSDLEEALKLDPTNKEIAQLRRRAQHELLKHQSRYRDNGEQLEEKRKPVILSANGSNPAELRRILIEEVEQPDISGTASDTLDVSEKVASRADARADASTKDMPDRVTAFDPLKTGPKGDKISRARKLDSSVLTSLEAVKCHATAVDVTAPKQTEKGNETTSSSKRCNLDINKISNRSKSGSDLLYQASNEMTATSAFGSPTIDTCVSNSLKKAEDDRADELRLKGNEQFNIGKLKAAETSYTNSIKLNAKCAATFANRALCRLRQSNYEGAIEDSSNAIMIDHRYWKAYHHRGSALQALGRLEEALEDMKKVLHFHPGEKNVLTTKQSIEKKLDDISYIPMRMGPMVIEEVENHEASLPLETSFGSCSDVRCKGVSNEQQDIAQQFRFTGNAHYHNKKYAEAIEFYSKSIDLNPVDAAAFANRALCYMKIGFLSEAKKDCTEALRLDPGYAKVYLRRSSINEKLGDLQSALSDMQKLHAHLPSDENVKAKMEELQKHLSFQAENLSDRTLECPEDVCRDGSTEIYAASHHIFEMAVSKNNSPRKVFLLDGNNEPPYPSNILEEPRSDEKMCREMDKNKKEVIKKDIIMKTSAVSVLPAKPKTALEFERGCLSTRHDSSLLRQFVKSLELSKYPAVFKDSLSSEIMKRISEALQYAFMPEDAKGALGVLQALVKVKRFKLVVMLHSVEVKQTLALVMEWISSCNIASVDVLCKLKSDYRL